MTKNIIYLLVFIIFILTGCSGTSGPPDGVYSTLQSINSWYGGPIHRDQITSISRAETPQNFRYGPRVIGADEIWCVTANNERRLLVYRIGNAWMLHDPSFANSQWDKVSC